jgi:DNA-binding XRE family transcriptional regulator
LAEYVRCGGGGAISCTSLAAASRLHNLTLALPRCHLTLKADRPKPYPKELNTLGDHLKKKRLDLGLFRKDVAKIIGVNTTTIRNWEINRFAPKIQKFFSSSKPADRPFDRSVLRLSISFR